MFLSIVKISVSDGWVDLQPPGGSAGLNKLI